MCIPILRISFHVVIYCFDEMCVRSFAIYLFLSCESSLHIMDIHSLSETSLENIFFQSIDLFFSFTVSFKKQKFFILMVLPILGLH